jgi:hypothetical protein
VADSAHVNSQTARRAALLVLWGLAAALWVVVFFRPQGSAPHLPSVGPSPPSVSAAPTPVAPLPGQLQAGPAGPGTAARGHRKHTSGPAPVDAEDIAEGDVEDEPQLAPVGVTGPIPGTGSLPGTTPLHSTVPIPVLPVTSPIPKLP